MMILLWNAQGGVLLGQSAFGKNALYMAKIFPPQSVTTLETFADMGLLLFLFMVGLELDLKQIRKTGRQALAIAAAGITLPFTAGVGVSFVLKQTIAQDVKFGPFLVFMGVAMSITAFPVLARNLAERKLLTTDVGQLAMSAAAVNDVVAWVLLALAVALSGSGKSPTIVLWVLLCGIAFVIFMIVAVRPVMTWIALHCTTNEPVKELYICVTLAGVLVAGFCTDAIGIHSIFGAFLLGLVIAKDGPFAGFLVEKLEDFVSILLLPLYFAISGLKTNVGSIHGATAGGLLVLVITVACLGKITGTFLAGKATNLTFNKSLTLGVLMNTKGLVELIVLNIGRSRGVR
jgi:Kef-type K+ transport system membrane component KefB